MRGIVEMLMRLWPLNQIMVAFWRYLPFPRGTRSRIMRGANDTFLVGVTAMIENEDGELLLVHNTYDPRYRWSLPGGWMGRNEQPEECIRRELREETGYEIEVDELFSVGTYRHLPSVDIVFRGHVVGGEFRPSVEVNEARYFSIDDLPADITPVHRQLLSRVPVRSSL